MANVLNPQELAQLLQQQQQQIAALQQTINNLQQQLQQAPHAAAVPVAPAHAHVPFKPHKPDTYDGRRTLSAVENWVFENEQFFEASGVEIGIDDERKIKFSAALLRKQAALWYRQHLARVEAGFEQPFETWQQYKNALIDAFRPVNATQVARDRLARARQRTSVAEFVNELRNLQLHIPNITDDELLDRFMRGLKYAIQKELVIRSPGSFEEAVTIAERLDAITFSLRRNEPAPNRNRYNGGPVPMEINTISQPQQPSQQQRIPRKQPTGNFPIGRGDGDQQRQFTKLTPELRQQLLREGKCLYCRQPGHMAVSCPNKGKPRQ